MKILIIEDDAHILSFLERGLQEEGYLVESSSDGEEGAYLATIYPYDVIVLDWMLPGKSGIEVLQYLRAKGVTIPVLMLTARGETADKVEGLRKGADDYLAKPFAYAELLARVEALYRRSLTGGDNRITLSDITIDLDAKRVIRGEETITLTSKEYALLLFLLKHRNAIVSVAMIEEQLWSAGTPVQSNVVQATMYHLRKKIGKGVIQSFRRLGYRIGDAQ